MKSISTWARDHKWASRFIIVIVIYPLLNITGLLFGGMLSLEEIELNASWYYLLSIPVFILLSTYPHKNKHYSYRRRKSWDAMLALSCFCFITVTGNQFNTSTSGITPAHALKSTSALTIQKKEKKTFKKIIRKLHKHYREASDAGKVLLIVLTIVGAFLLVYLLAALSCSIACSGYEAFGYLIFTLGLGGIVFGTIRAIQSITGKRKKKKQPQMQSS
jgi:hypothetical protein